MAIANYPQIGFGLGLRPPHYVEVLETPDLNVDWFEVISENFMVPGGRPWYFLDRVKERYPIVLHGVSLSIGSVDPLDFAYLKALKRLIDRVNPVWVSDHLCWTGVDAFNTHDLLPLPYTEEALDHVVARVQRVQEFLGRQILLENPSTYVNFVESTLTEWDFLSLVAERSDCLILLDINNIYVNAYNHGFNSDRYLDRIPQDRVLQFHMAGHTNKGNYIIDTHDAAVISPVWALYQKALGRFPHAATLIERDDHIPSLSELLGELNKARALAQRVSTSNCLRDPISKEFAL